MQKVILKVDWSCEKSKKKAIKIVSENKDVQGFAVDEENKQLTVDGDMDAVSLVEKMRRKFPTTEIVFLESDTSRAVEAPPAPPEPKPQDNYTNRYPGYHPDPYGNYRNHGYGPYPAYGHPYHHNHYNRVPSAPLYWDYNGYYGPQ